MSFGVASTTRDDLLTLLDRLYEVIRVGSGLDAEPKYFDTPEPLSRAEVHTVSAVAVEPGIGVAELAEQHGVSRSAASQMVTRLVSKGLVCKRRASGRHVHLEVTPLGERAHRAHERFHDELVHALAPFYGSRA